MTLIVSRVIILSESEEKLKQAIIVGVTKMKRYVKDNPKMEITLDCKFAVTVHWCNKSHTVKVYTNESGERYINLQGHRWYL